MSMDTGLNTEMSLFIMPYFPSESGLSQFIYAFIKILEKHLLFCACDRT